MTAQQSIANQTKLWRVDNFHSLELLKATYTTYSFPKHLHETYVIEIVEQGIDEFFCEGKIHSAPAGSVIIINPYEVHTGRSAGKNPLIYSSMYPATALVQAIIKEIDDTTINAPSFGCHVIQDRNLFRKLLALHRAFEHREDVLTCDTLMLTAFSHLIENFSEQRLVPVRYKYRNFRLARVKEFLIEKYSEKICLETLSRISDISPWYLLRSFRKTFGIPPHEFLTNIRVERAKQLIADHMPIARVACETGFCDQSHLTRHFKRLVGLTPGQYALK